MDPKNACVVVTTDGFWARMIRGLIAGFLRSIVVNVVLWTVIGLVILCGGCQFDIQASTSSKMFYKNSDGQGDPRTGMYQGSGYQEKVNGGEVSPQGGGFTTIGR